MKNQEFLARFARHLLRSASSLRIESPKTALAAAPAVEIKKAGPTPLEAEMRQAEEMMRRRFQIPQPAKMMPSMDISKLGDKEFAIPAPKLSEEEVSLRKELEKAREKIIRGITAPPVTEEKKAVQPQPAAEIEAAFDLGKINVFIKNPEIISIECNGPNNVLVVKKGLQAINTTTTLSTDEINDLIHKFSVASKTEITPIFKAAAKDLIMTAFISPIIGTRFVLSKVKKVILG